MKLTNDRLTKKIEEYKQENSDLKDENERLKDENKLLLACLRYLGLIDKLDGSVEEKGE